MVWTVHIYTACRKFCENEAHQCQYCFRHCQKNSAYKSWEHMKMTSRPSIIAFSYTRSHSSFYDGLVNCSPSLSVCVCLRERERKRVRAIVLVMSNAARYFTLIPSYFTPIPLQRDNSSGVIFLNIMSWHYKRFRSNLISNPKHFKYLKFQRNLQAQGKKRSVSKRIRWYPG